MSYISALRYWLSHFTNAVDGVEVISAIAADVLIGYNYFIFQSRLPCFVHPTGYPLKWGLISIVSKANTKDKDEILSNL